MAKIDPPDGCHWQQEAYGTTKSCEVSHEHKEDSLAESNATRSLSDGGERMFLLTFVSGILIIGICLVLVCNGADPKLSLAVALGLVAGPSVLAASLWNWDFFFEHSLARTVVSRLGRTGARLFCFLCGVMLLGCAGWILSAGVQLKDSAREAQEIGAARPNAPSLKLPAPRERISETVTLVGCGIMFLGFVVFGVGQVWEGLAKSDDPKESTESQAQLTTLIGIAIAVIGFLLWWIL